MRTYFSETTKMCLLIGCLAYTGNLFGQKTVDNQSVGSKLEEISDKIYAASVETGEKVKDFVVEQNAKLLSKEDQAVINSTIEESKEWGEVQYNEFMDAVKDVKSWLSKQYFAPVKAKAKESPQANGDNKQTSL